MNIWNPENFPLLSKLCGYKNRNKKSGADPIVQKPKKNKRKKNLHRPRSEILDGALHPKYHATVILRIPESKETPDSDNMWTTLVDCCKNAAGRLSSMDSEDNYLRAIRESRGRRRNNSI